MLLSVHKAVDKQLVLYQQGWGRAGAGHTILRAGNLIAQPLLTWTLAAGVTAWSAAAVQPAQLSSMDTHDAVGIIG